MHVTVKQRLTQLGSIIDRWWLIGLTSLVASYLALDVAQNVLAEWSPRALDVAEAALISLGALAALIFGYTILLPENDPNRRSFYRAAQQTKGKLSRNAWYNLASDPARALFDTLNIIPALKEITGKPVELTNLLDYSDETN